MTDRTERVSAYVSALKDLIADALASPGTTAAGRRQLQDLLAFVARLEELPALEARLDDLKAQVGALGDPPLQYGVFLGTIPPRPSDQETERRLTLWQQVEPLVAAALAALPAGATRDRERLEALRESLMWALATVTADRNLVIGLHGQQYEVNVAAADIVPSALREGQEVVLNKTLNVVGVRAAYLRGDTAEVLNVLSPSGTVRVIRVPTEGGPLRVQGTDGTRFEVACTPELLPTLRAGDIVRLDEAGQCAEARVKPRLHVRTGGSDGTVVEIADRLFHDGVTIGDIVRVDLQLKFAFEKLPAYETGGLALEEIPDVDYEDIGGLDAQITLIRDTIELPYLHRTLFERYQLPRSKGILLHGPPGCGKTLIAKAVANNLTRSIRTHLAALAARLKTLADLRRNPHDAEALARGRQLLGADRGAGAGTPIAVTTDAGAEMVVAELVAHLRARDMDVENPDAEHERIQDVLDREDGVRSFFLNVKGPELLNKYVGETEHRIRKIFEDAKRRASFYTPVVVFFDEMEAMFRARGSGLSSDVETTIVPQLLAEMDGVEVSEDVIIIGASNRPELVDPAVLRPGRLDAKIEIKLPDREAAHAILALNLTPDLPLRDDTAIAIGMQRVTFKPHVVRRTLAAAMRTPLARAQLDAILVALPPDMDLRKALTRSPEFVKACEANGVGKAMVDEGAHREWLAESLIVRLLALLYSPSSRLDAVTANGRRVSYPLSEFTGGAVIVNVVLRAKRAAVKREATEASTVGTGLTAADLREAVWDEFDSNADQLAAMRFMRDPAARQPGGQPPDSILYTELRLGEEEIDPWSIEKVLVGDL